MYTEHAASILIPLLVLGVLWVMVRHWILPFVLGFALAVALGPSARPNLTEAATPILGDASSPLAEGHQHIMNMVRLRRAFPICASCPAREMEAREQSCLCLSWLYPPLKSTEEIMCYERRSLASDEHKKASADASRSKEQNQNREEVVSNLLRETDKLEQKANSAPAKEYTPAK